MSAWQGRGGVLARAVEAQNARLEETYRADPSRLEQDANIERSIAEGAYAQRQLFELIQNAADAMRGTARGRVEVILTGSTLYAANSGNPLSVQGIETLMATHRSAKRDEQIGRFGLGFKSTLAVTDSPRIFSRTGSVRFDRQESAQRLAGIVPGASHYPAARMAWPLDPVEGAADDPILASLMKWAVTVVVLPIKAHADVLERSMKNFPAEFLLFSPQVTQLGLEDRSTGTSRQITLSTTKDGAFQLDDANKHSQWVVRTKRHDPSKAAMLDGGYHAARETLEISWAAPLSGAPSGVGAFWSYFPTTSITTLSGIVNAPWKLAEDRESLLPGKFNGELLTHVLPALVADSLDLVYRPERAMAVLDVLPARGKESRNWADDQINEPIMSAVSKRLCLPTLAGTLGSAARVKVHPEGLTPDELAVWARACTDPERWLDHGVQSAERRAKVTRLLRYHQRTSVSVKEWVEHLVKSPSVEGSAAAVQLVAALRGRSPELASELARARVLLLDDGSVHACVKGQVFMPGGSQGSGKLIIDPVLAGDPAVESALKSLGIEIFNSAGALHSELSAQPIAWDRVWQSARKISVDEAVVIFRESLGREAVNAVRVRTASGQWKRGSEVFLPGPVIPADSGRDRDYVVDSRYHAQDLELLDRLGLVSEPALLTDPPAEAWVTAKMQEYRDEYRRKTRQVRLADDSIIFTTGRRPWPLEPLPHLSLEARAAVTSALLGRLDADQEWDVWTGSSRAHRGTMNDPVWSWLRRFGALPTQAGLQPIDRCLRVTEDSVIDGVIQPLPFVESPLSDSQLRRLMIKHSLDDLSDEDWGSLFEAAGGWEDERRFLLYAWGAFAEAKPPARLKVRRGRGHVEVPVSQVAVTTDDDVFQSLVSADIPSMLAISSDDEERLLAWGMARGKDMLVEQIDVATSGEPFSVVDRFPPLRNMGGAEFDRYEIQPCSRIELLTSTPSGQRSRPLKHRVEGTTVYLIAADDDATVLTRLLAALELTGRVKPDVILKRMEEQRLSKRRREIRQTEGLPAKLVAAIGVDALKAGVPSDAIKALERDKGGELDDVEIAALSIAVHGYGVLAAHVRALTKRGLHPPTTWGGRPLAREWVRDLGFPIELAGFSGRRPEAEVEIDGPPILNELHDFQRTIADRIHGLLDPEAEVRRGLVSLPTGAGKTRVAVESLVDYIRDSADTDVRIVWLAQTEELCEQAAGAWTHVWRAKGPVAKPMVLSRLWGSNETVDRDGHRVVVTSVQKLQAIVGRPDWQQDYGWLRHPTMIVVDEAHKSITPAYTETLSALGGTNRVVDMNTPLLGLTATPFRGYNEKETQTLAGRYHRNLLSADAFGDEQAYVALQRRGVLARPRFQELEGATIELNTRERAHAEQMGVLSRQTEQRLGEDAERNATIVDAVRRLGDAERALLFATSVENAKTLAALLTFHGIEARAVSGETDGQARRQYIEDFRAGRVRVLTNYSVFTEGFDVPGIDAVFITRPTYSPNVYQQMVGRGLRGPLNGGNEEVLIVNVADNVTNFAEEFAFRHFDRLWGEGASA